MRKQTILWSCAALLILASGSWAQDKQPFIGVLLDEEPLPELLTKHLGLEPGQGLRVVNICVGTTADKAGLDRDDILIAFQGRKLTDVNEFIATIKEAGVGAKVSLQVIHLGQRKTVELQLEPLGKMEWKYPPEPDPVPVDIWQPINIFQRGPGGQQWLEIPRDRLHEFNLNMENIFREKYTYRFTTDDGEFTVTIEGRPADEDTKVVVRAGEEEYNTTVGAIDTLPEKYRGSAKQAVENAKKDFRITGRIRLPELPRPDMYGKYLPSLPQLDMDRLYEQKDRALERLQQEMDRLQQRMQELEQRNREMLDRLLDRKDEPEPDQTDQPAPGRLPDGESI